MALLFIDGFDHYASADVAKKWTSNTGCTIAATGRRTSGSLVALGGNSAAKTYAAASTLIAGVALSLSVLPTSARSILSLTDVGTAQVSVRLNLDGTLSVMRGPSSGTVLATSASALAAGSFNYIELKATIHNTAGAYELRVNGVAVVGPTTSANTRNTANASANGVLLGWDGNPGTATVTYDDFYICDGTGSTNNTFLGDVRIDTLFPTGDGASSAFTPSTGTTHWSLVDEAAVNTTDYVDGISAGDRDLYTFPALTTLATSTVYGVQVCNAALKDDAGSRSIAAVARSSSTNVDGTAAGLSTSQLVFAQVFETDSASAAWTQTSVNAAQFGVKVAV